MTTKTLLTLGMWCCVPLLAAAIPPSAEQSRKASRPRPNLPTGNSNTPSMSQGMQRSARPQQSSLGRSSAGSYSSAAHQREQASLLPGGTNNRPAPSRYGNDRPVFDRQPENQRPGGSNQARPNFGYPGGRPGQNNLPINRPDVVVNRPDININRPTINRPTINRPITNINNTQINNTNISRPTINNTIINNSTTINQNYGNQNFVNRSGNYANRYSGDYNYRRPRDYYPHLHSHWQPTSWAAAYTPAYYNYNYSTAVAGGGVLSVSATNYAYSNPFYAQPQNRVVVYDYTQPLHVPTVDYQETSEDMVRSERAIRRFDLAREDFYAEKYDAALQHIDEAIQLLPSDPNLHQFRALILFELRRYDEAGAVLYSVLAVSPGWETSTIARLYNDPNVYLSQVRSLEKYAALNPNSLSAQFLLVYHRLIKGDLAGAQRLLESIAAAKPDDRVVQNLLSALRG
jgi:tetratricopeptide (TPR) repeat protein